MSEYEIRTTELTVISKGDPIYDQSAIRISISDDAAGEFITLRQVNDVTDGEIRISPGKWPTLREAIDRMIGECRS